MLNLPEHIRVKWHNLRHPSNAAYCQAMTENLMFNSNVTLPLRNLCSNCRSFRFRLSASQQKVAVIWVWQVVMQWQSLTGALSDELVTGKARYGEQTMLVETKRVCVIQKTLSRKRKRNLFTWSSYSYSKSHFFRVSYSKVKYLTFLMNPKFSYQIKANRMSCFAIKNRILWKKVHLILWNH